MFVKRLDKEDELLLTHRRNVIRDYQEKGICFSCQNFISGDIFPDNGLVIYEDELVRCLFEKYPKATGQTIIVSKHHYEDISEMPIDLGTHILKLSDAIIKLYKKILDAEKVYICTICDGKRNHLHFQLLPRLKGETIGYQNFAREEGVLIDYQETANLYREALKNIKL